MPTKKRLQVGLIPLQKAADLEGKYRRQTQKDDDENVGQRGCEITAQFAPENHQNLVHARGSAALPDTSIPGGARWVKERNTSSRRPDSKCNSGTSQLYLLMIALTADKALAPGFGTAVSLSSRASDSISATSGNRAIS